jgi:hypothetical protein
MEVSRSVPGNPAWKTGSLRGLNFDELIESLPEQDLWRLLQDVIASEIELKDTTIRQLDDRMQGFLFLQEYVTNRAARIEFARSPGHMAYLRDAAGSRNVWMDDQEFSDLVHLDDSATLACFARSEQMRPHHLAYIAHKLEMHPHRQELLATSDDARITLIKALEIQGNSSELALIRLAKAALEGADGIDSVIENCAPGAIVRAVGDPRALWRAYVNLRALDQKTIMVLLEKAGLSTVGPIRTSQKNIRSLH